MNILTKFIELTLEALKDNKKLIIALYLLFIICFALSWLLSVNAINTAINNVNGLNSSTSVYNANPIELLIHNEWGTVVTYVSSLLFGVPAIISLIYNAVSLGLIGQLLSTVVPKGGLTYIIYLIPHGIFEITATVLSSVAGLLLFYFIWSFVKAKRNKETDAFSKTKKIFIQSFVIFIFSVILLVIAAPIEAYFSVPFSEFIVGML